MKKSKGLFVFVVSMFSMAYAYAGIESIQYSGVHAIDHNKNLDKNTKTYINPVTNLTVNISAGLNRKVRFEIRNTAGDVLSSSTSGLVDINDRLTGSAGDYYGKKLTVGVPSDGEYNAVALILDNKNTVVQEDVYPVVIDTQKPSGVDVSWSLKVDGWELGRIGHVSPYGEFSYISASGISDENKIEKITFIGGEKTSGNVQETKVNASYKIDNNGKSLYLNNTIPNDPDIFTKEQGEYNIGFRVWDYAGNYADFTHVSKVEMKNNYMLPVREIWNPNSQVWESYVSGMTIFENPYKIRYKFLKEEMSVNNPDGYGWGYVSISYQDDVYAYHQRTWLVPASASYAVPRTISGSELKVIRAGDQNLTLSEETEKAPKGVYAKYKSNNNLDYWSGNSRLYTSDAISKGVSYRMTDIRYEADKRSYRQLVYSNLPTENEKNRCVIEPNESACEIQDVGYNAPTSGNGYTPYAVWVCKSTNGESCDSDSFGASHFTYFYVVWDKNPLIISNVSVNNETISYELSNNDLTGRWNDSMYRVKDVQLCLTDLISGNKTTVNYTDVDAYNTQTSKYSFNLTSLSEGKYKINACASDVHFNETIELVTEEYTKDATPPEVTFTDSDKVIANNVTLKGLEGLRIKVQDDLSYQLTSVKLQGGPINDSLLLATRDLSNDEYALEYPRIFPSLEEGQEYTLTVTAIDEQQNATVSQLRFEYIPLNMKNIGTLTTLAVNKNLLYLTDEPIGMIKVVNIRIDDGPLINGVQDLLFTLRGDAKYSVNVSGKSVAPGETIFIEVNAQNGEIKMPIFPAVSNIAGEASFIVEIPVLK